MERSRACARAFATYNLSKLRETREGKGEGVPFTHADPGGSHFPAGGRLKLDLLAKRKAGLSYDNVTRVSQL